jgi:hypothetical protein
MAISEHPDKLIQKIDPQVFASKCKYLHVIRFIDNNKKKISSLALKGNLGDFENDIVNINKQKLIRLAKTDDLSGLIIYVLNEEESKVHAVAIGANGLDRKFNMDVDALMKVVVAAAK